jgi:hypothetical protein
LALALTVGKRHRLDVGLQVEGGGDLGGESVAQESRRGMTFDRYDDGYCDEEEAARRMGVSIKRVRELVRRGVLRGRDGLVQPAVISGAIG